MGNRIVRIFVAFCVLLLSAGASCCAKSGKTTFPRHIKYTVLPVPPMSSLYSWEPSGKISPDGRWLVYFDARAENYDKDSRAESRDKVIFYDLVKSRLWHIRASHAVLNSDTVRVLSWRPDSRACAVGDVDGWRIFWPDTRKTKWISHSAAGYESCAAWSPHTNRLAIFGGGYGDGLYHIWNGKTLTPGIDWMKAVDYPYPEGRAWQCEWSPDEKLILFRFYGHAERDSYSAGHTVVINPKTSRWQFHWGVEAGPAHWLDNSRLMFEGDDESSLTYGLTVAKPVSQQSDVWLKNTLAWTFSRQHDTVWAITTKGNLYQTSLRKKQWKMVCRNAVSRKSLKMPSFNSPSLSAVGSLFLSPRGDMIVFHARWGNSISLISTSRQYPWKMSWQAPTGSVRVLGWQSGKSLPLLEWQRNENNLCIIQLKR